MLYGLFVQMSPQRTVWCAVALFPGTTCNTLATSRVREYRADDEPPGFGIEKLFLSIAEREKW